MFMKIAQVIRKYRKEAGLTQEEMAKDDALNTEGLADYYKKTLPEILKVDVEGWKKEVKDIRENHYPKFGKHLPKELNEILDDLESRLNKA